MPELQEILIHVGNSAWGAPLVVGRIAERTAYTAFRTKEHPMDESAGPRDTTRDERRAYGTAVAGSEPFRRCLRNVADEALLVDLQVHETVIRTLQREGHARLGCVDGLPAEGTEHSALDAKELSYGE
jgi:hypothetical protein